MNLEKNKGNLLIFLTAFLWSLGGIFLKYTSGFALAVNAGRSFVAFICFLIYKKGIKITINKYVISAALCLTCTNVLFVFANQLTSAANAIVLQYLAPLLVLIWNSIYTKKRPSLVQCICVIIAFSGMILFFFDQLDGGHLIGNILSIISAFTFSGVYFINSFEEAKTEDATMLGTFLSVLIGIPFIKSLPFTMPNITALILLGTLQIFLAYVVFGKGSKLTSPVNASLIGLLEAVMNPLWVFIFYHEAIGKFAFIGAIIILSSIIINILYTNKQDVVS